MLTATCSYDYASLSTPHQPDSGGTGNHDASAGRNQGGAGGHAGTGGAAAWKGEGGASGKAPVAAADDAGAGAAVAAADPHGESLVRDAGGGDPGLASGMGGPGGRAWDAGTPPVVDATADVAQGSDEGDTDGGSDRDADAPEGAARLDPDLVIWYPFDDSSGTTAHDLAMAPGGPHDGMLLTTGAGGTASFSALPQVGTHALALTGNGSAAGGYVSLPTLEKLAPDAVTLAVWVYPTSSARSQRVFDFGSSDNVTMSLTTSQGTDSSGTARFSMTSSGTVDEQRIDSAAPLTLNAWHHLCVSLPTGDSYMGTLYVDGAAAGINNLMTLHPADLSTTTKNYIGRSQYATDPYLSGRIDDFRVYRRSLTAAEVAALYALR